MIKGAQKKMIVVRTGNSRYFETAYFVMKNETDAQQDRRDMLAEANAIIEGVDAQPKKKESGRRSVGVLLRGFLFMSGLLLGSGGLLLLQLILR